MINTVKLYSLSESEFLWVKFNINFTKVKENEAGIS